VATSRDRVVLDDLETGLLLLDGHDVITWHNRAAERLLARHRQRSELNGQALAALLPGLITRLHQARQSHHRIQAAELTLDDGQVVDVSLNPIEPQATHGQLLIELWPVAERVRQRQSTDRADRQRATALLARHLAHELRNPLAGVRAAAQLISQRGHDDTSSRHAEMILRGVDRITELIGRFSGEQAQCTAMVNLHQTMGEAAELVVAEYQSSVALVPDFDPSIPEFMADGGQLHQLFLNLFRNSAQAGATRIQVQTRIEHQSPLVEQPARSAVRIDIQDNGHGVPESLRERLFLPLVSGREHGSGFGLAIAQQIARGHGGLIEHHPCVEGSLFCVRLPLITRELAQREQAQREPTQRNPSVPA